MSVEELPVTRFVKRICQIAQQPDLMMRFQEHVAPLEMEAKGEVLVIGPGEFMEEVALAEPEMDKSLVSKLTLIGARPVLTEEVLEASQGYNIPIEVDGISWGGFFDQNPRCSFDTIILIGTISSYLPEKIREISSHLNKGGRFFGTVNYIDEEARHLENLPELEGYQIEVISDIPTNPNYSAIPTYFGLRVKKD